MTTNLSSISWGIVGGMGPLASAEFVRTIYEAAAVGRYAEQSAPRLLLLSDPSFPDRTSALAAGEEVELVARLGAAVSLLAEQGAEAVVVCCVTIHSVLDQLPAELRALVVPLTDIILRAAAEGEGRHLLLCTKGCRVARLFEQHPLWPAARGRVVLPSEEDQEAVHELIYAVKRNCWDASDAARLVCALLEKYEAVRAIAGCTELHLVSKRFGECGLGRVPLFDPLTVLAERIAGGKFFNAEEGLTECAESLAFSS
ncbi:MAG TPA: amino acid racemase [Pyrinomonadaceae bacterium]|nr:amino acid racemase [Pyrinomonadaceae bacterium]